MVSNLSTSNMIRTLRVSDNMQDLNIDLLLCVCSVLGTAIVSTVVGFGMFGDSMAINSVWAGALRAIIYLQSITILVYAISYCSDVVRAYRSTIIALAIFGIYTATRFLYWPEDTSTIYSYSATITSIAIIIFKLKTLLGILLDNVKVSNVLECKL